MPIGEKLRDALSRHVVTARPTPEAWSLLQRRARRQRVRRRVSVGFGVIAVLGAFSLALFLLWTALGVPRPEVRPAEGPVGVPVDPRVTAKIPVGQFPANLAVGEGAVWVTVEHAQPPGAWVLRRIDPAINEVTGSLELPAPGDVSVGAGAVWVATWSSGEPALLRVDPATMAVSHEIPLGGSDPDQVTVGAGAVWITVHGDPPDETELVQVDPATGVVVNRVGIPGDGRDLAATEDAVWVVSLTYRGDAVDHATVYRVPANGEGTPMLVIEGATPLSGIHTPTVITAGYGAVWSIAEETRDVGRVDPENGEVQEVRIDRPFLPFGAGEGGIWFGEPGDDPVISRLNPGTFEVDAEVPVEGIAVDAALDPESGTIWVANYERTVTRVDLRP
jgi:hypothetical protein